MAKKPTTGTAVANLDEELAALAGKSATLTSSGGGGRFFSTKSGVLQFDDTPLPGNQMCVIIAAWCLENVYYADDYDADNRTPPACFAFSKDTEDKDEMAPHLDVDKEDIFERQSDKCDGCPQNEFGSAKRGRGKACSNRRRLAVIPAGTYKSAGRNGGYELELINDLDHFSSAEEAYLKVPVMSGKGFDAYVRELKDQFSKPGFCFYTRIWLSPDPKSQFKINFELIEPVENEMLPVLMQRYKKINEAIDFPYAAFTPDEEEAPKPASKKLAGKGGAARKR